MKNISLSEKEMTNLKNIFNENYLMIKRVKEFEKKIYDENIRIMLKEIRDSHEKNLLTVMKLLDEKERFI